MVRTEQHPLAPEVVEVKSSLFNLWSFTARKLYAQLYYSSSEQNRKQIAKIPLQVADRSHKHVSDTKHTARKAERHQDSLK